MLSIVRRWPAWLVLGLLAMISTVVHVQTFPDQLWPKIPELVIFYALGVYGAAPLLRLAELATGPRVVVLALVAGVVPGLGGVAQGRAAVWLFIPRGAGFLALAVVAVAVAVRWAPLRRLGVALGRQTLGIYVLHPLWIALLTIAVAGPARGAFEAVLAQPVLAMAYPAVMTVAIIAISMPVRRLAERVGLGWLVALPASWETGPARLARRRHARTDANTASTPSLGSTTGAWAPPGKELT